jgi:hypothetical protein
MLVPTDVAEEVIGEGTIQHLLVECGYLDGAWLTELHERGTRVTIKTCDPDCSTQSGF